MIKQGSAIVDEVILHTLAVPTNWYRGRSAEDILLAVREWHTTGRKRAGKKPWRKEGYHRIIAPDGEIAIGRSLYEQGAGVRGHNRGTIHIALCNVNEVTKISKFEDWYTREQRVALRDYLLDLEKLIGHMFRVTGHNDYANKLCPGFKVHADDWL